MQGDYLWLNFTTTKVIMLSTEIPSNLNPIINGTDFENHYVAA